MKWINLFSLLSLLMLGQVLPATASTDEGAADPVVYDGYFSREENDGKMAKLTGKSHYVKFYPDNRVIRLYIPYPYALSIKPEVMLKVFDKVNSETTGIAYIQGTFDLLDEKIIAHTDLLKRIGGELMFDCGSSAPCRIFFEDNVMKVIKKGVINDNLIHYEHVMGN